MGEIHQKSTPYRAQKTWERLLESLKRFQSQQQQCPPACTAQGSKVCSKQQSRKLQLHRKLHSAVGVSYKYNVIQELNVFHFRVTPGLHLRFQQLQCSLIVADLASTDFSLMRTFPWGETTTIRIWVCCCGPHYLDSLYCRPAHDIFCVILRATAWHIDLTIE